jgi:hypothetical protein
MTQNLDWPELYRKAFPVRRPNPLLEKAIQQTLSVSTLAGWRVDGLLPLYLPLQTFAALASMTVGSAKYYYKNGKLRGINFGNTILIATSELLLPHEKHLEGLRANG